MFRSFIKTAFRSILRERYYAVLKIAGLALGIGTSLVLLLYISHQLSYDRFHPNADRTYRINQTNIWDPTGGNYFSSTGPAVASQLQDDFPEIDATLRINTPGGAIMRYVTGSGEVKAINESKILAADSNFFSFFAFPLAEGNAETALVGKNKVVLSDRAAKRFFGDESALGKTILWGDERIALEVTGVTTEQPLNAHFTFDYMLSMYSNENLRNMEWSWIWTQVVTYIRVKPNADINTLALKLKTTPDRHAPATFQKLHMNYEEFKRERGGWELVMQPLTEVHLYSVNIWNRLGPSGDIRYIYVFGIVAAFILLIAIINFVNLSTARATKRAKEVGVKKTLGLMRGALVTQFQVEHILVTSAAMLLGLGFMELLRLVLQPIAGITIPLNVWGPGIFAMICIFLPVAVGFLAGLYPSFYLTSFRPAEVLKGRLTSGARNARLRNMLVVFQFAISIALMAATFIVFQQLRFFQSQNLGFDKDNILILNNADKLGKQLESFRDEIATYPGVRDAALSMDVRQSMEDIFISEDNQIKLPIAQLKIDEHFFKTFGLTLAAGRGYDVNRPSDKDAVLLNETAVRLYGWKPEEALGKRILYLGDDVGPQEVIGVVKDFNFQSLRQNITPFIFININSDMWNDTRVVAIKVNTDSPADLINMLEKRWNALTEAVPFEYSFYNDEIMMRYQEEERLGSLFSIFTGLSITIAVIGLIGLAAYSAEQRRKEIGVRKVFGASLTSIYVMMNVQYVRLMLVALVIATPLTWWVMQQWLNTYTYRVSIAPWIFVMAGVIELALALACVGYLALRAASVNPSQVLKDE